MLSHGPKRASIALGVSCRRSIEKPMVRHERAYTRRQRAVTFVGTKRTITIPLETADFERLERLAVKRNIGNATLARQIIRKYLRRKDAELF
jgi:predicted DNA-binding ribbon-helix-helix protein